MPSEKLSGLKAGIGHGLVANQLRKMTRQTQIRLGFTK